MVEESRKGALPFGDPLSCPYGRILTAFSCQWQFRAASGHGYLLRYLLGIIIIIYGTYGRIYACTVLGEIPSSLSAQLFEASIPSTVEAGGGAQAGLRLRLAPGPPGLGHAGPARAGRARAGARLETFMASLRTR